MGHEPNRLRARCSFLVVFLCFLPFLSFSWWSYSGMANSTLFPNACWVTNSKKSAEQAAFFGEALAKTRLQGKTCLIWAIVLVGCDSGFLRPIETPPSCTGRNGFQSSLRSNTNGVRKWSEYVEFYSCLHRYSWRFDFTYHRITIEVQNGFFLGSVDQCDCKIIACNV